MHEREPQEWSSPSTFHIPPLSNSIIIIPTINKANLQAGFFLDLIIFPSSHISFPTHGWRFRYPTVIQTTWRLVALLWHADDILMRIVHRTQKYFFLAFSQIFASLPSQRIPSPVSPAIPFASLYVNCICQRIGDLNDSYLWEHLFLVLCIPQ